MLFCSVIMEEAAQILEIESLIPLLLQQNINSVDSSSRLKRVVMIGDHYQLPPVVTNAVMQKHSKLDQSMFSRFIRLGVPSVLLDKQGRCRPEIAALYSWRYRAVPVNSLNEANNAAIATHSLDNLGVVSEGVYSSANAGFLFTHQLVNVPDFQGKGETTPTAHYYQNLGEAEYVVAVYQYMRLLGYPREKISILTTYNGQRKLIYDVAQRRCTSPVFGVPIVSTVDKYQGQQNDYILLSLVRTRAVGHIHDVRRLVVAMSRARLGLYVFCRLALFQACYDLSPVFNQLTQRPCELQLTVGEAFPTERLASQTVSATAKISINDVTAMGVLVYRMVQQSQNLSGLLAPSAKTSSHPDNESSSSVPADAMNAEK
jgi:intron-binding protein aquarius